jgi:3-oxoacyl-[acyl-carrier protein] reductase
MQFDFREKVILVTGGSSGIGRAIALLFAEAGGQVAVHYGHNREGAEATLRMLPGTGHMLAQADIREAAAVENMVGEVVAQMQRIDVLVNNAGIFPDHPIAEIDYDQWQAAWERTIFTNLIGPANVTFCVVRQMIGQGGGRIVNVSSRGAFRGEPNAPAYGASKAGLNAMGQSLAQALAPHNIFVHTVAPGYVETDRVQDTLGGPRGEEIRNQSPLGRVAQPEEVARTILFLAADETKFLTGCIVDVNGASYLRT